jgi:hypothetical protein
MIAGKPANEPPACACAAENNRFSLAAVTVRVAVRRRPNANVNGGAKIKRRGAVSIAGGRQRVECRGATSAVKVDAARTARGAHGNEVRGSWNAFGRCSIFCRGA